MKNLKLLYRKQIENLSSLLEDCVCTAVDCDTGYVFVAVSKGEIIQIDPSTKTLVESVSLPDEGYLPLDKRVINLQYQPEQQALCIITDHGSVLLWYTIEQSLVSVGNVESGLTGAAWSPDQELLILATGDDKLILMTQEFDSLNETVLHPDEFGEAEFVNVGWGKKETQFHGSEGKAAAQRKVEQNIKPSFEWDDHKTYISWCGDGQYFVTSTVHPQTGARQLRVWTREAVLYSTGETVSLQEKSLAWKPSGSLIASSQIRPNKHEVIFFERNGLRHGEFTLPFPVGQVQVKGLFWNVDSTVLLVWCEDLKLNEGNSKSYVQLWSVNNYHWYLKQSLHFDAIMGKKVASVMWDAEHAYVLHLLTAAGCYIQYTWYWDIDVSSDSTVAVIDGDKVLVTPMANMVVPPPMSAYQLVLPAAANQVFFFSPEQSESHCNTPVDIGVVLVDGQIAVFTYENASSQPDNSVIVATAGDNGFSVKCLLPHLQAIYKQPFAELSDGFLMDAHRFLGIGPQRLLYCCEENDTSVLCQVSLSPDEQSLKEIAKVKVSTNIYQMIFCGTLNLVFIQNHHGVISTYNPDTQSFSVWELASGEKMIFPQLCPNMYVCKIGQQVAVLGLTSRHRFYINNTEVMTNCTSVAIHDDFLLMTSLSHTCRFISRDTAMKALPVLHDNKDQPFDEVVRRVERGSRIVTVVHDQTKLVLQMPRGNLETIYPRALLLSSIRRKLNSQFYRDALLMMRKHRINMNLTYDHNRTSFLANVQTFIEQISSDNLLTLFLTDLSEEDVTLSMYAAAYPGRSQDSKENVPEAKTKVNVVCDALLQSLYEANKEKFLLPIITAHVKKNPPELEKALELVHNLKVSPSNIVSLEETLRHLLCMVDINQLYDIALGMYDFDIVLMVAEKSQKDPKEYLPYLNSLRQMETNYQRYTIDKHLRRFPKALQHITKCGHERFNECLQFIEQHKLHKEALQLYEPTQEEFQLVAASYAGELKAHRLYEEAAVMYVKAADWENALQCFQTSHNAEQVMCMAQRLSYTPEKLANLASSFAGTLKSLGHHQNASMLYEQYANDVEEAIVTLIDGGFWDGSLRLMHKYDRTDFIESNLKDAIVTAFHDQMESLQTFHIDFMHYKNRLFIVREEKRKARLEILDDEGCPANVDLYSDASSVAVDSVVSHSSSSSKRSGTSSHFSRSTGRSSRNRRKDERKKWSLKEGSRYEEYALVDALGKIISHMDILQGDVRKLLLAMVQFNYDDKASELQDFYSSFLDTIEKVLPSLQETVETDQSQNQSFTFGPGVTANVIAEAVQQGQKLPTNKAQDSYPSIPSRLHHVKWKLHMIGKNK